MFWDLIIIGVIAYMIYGRRDSRSSYRKMPQPPERDVTNSAGDSHDD